MRALPILVVLVLLAGCASEPEPAPTSSTGPTKTTSASATQRTGHEHAVFRMFNDTHEIRFDDARFDYASTRHVRAHLHLAGPEASQAQYVIHAEGQLGYDLHEFFATLDVQIMHAEVQLDEHVHGGKTLVNNATHSWQLWVDPCKAPPDDWTRIRDWTQYQPKQLDRMLIAYAPSNSTPANLGNQTAKVPSAAELEERYGEKCPSQAQPS